MQLHLLVVKNQTSGQVQSINQSRQSPRTPTQTFRFELLNITGPGLAAKDLFWKSCLEQQELEKHLRAAHGTFLSFYVIQRLRQQHNRRA